MTIEERLAALLEHGVGCPQAVRLGGPAAVEAWCEQQEVTLEAAAADAEEVAALEKEAALEAAEAAEVATADAEARATTALENAEAAGPVEVTAGDPAPEDPAGLPVGALGHVLDRLDRLEAAVDALASQAPPLEAVEAVAASPEPEPKGKKKAGKK